MFTDNSKAGIYEINCEIFEVKQVVITRRNIEKGVIKFFTSKVPTSRKVYPSLTVYSNWIYS